MRNTIWPKRNDLVRATGSGHSPTETASSQSLLGLAYPSKMALTNPWESVETIGKANAGKKQPREGDARLLDRHLFESAAAGDEGALALLVQLYLGLRPSEVLGLTVGGVEGAVVYVNGTKNKNAVRKLELYAPVAELLVAFCQGRPKSERIFARDRPTQPTAGWMYKRLENFCIRLQIPHICPHALRGLHSSLALGWSDKPTRSRAMRAFRPPRDTMARESIGDRTSAQLRLSNGK